MKGLYTYETVKHEPGLVTQKCVRHLALCAKPSANIRASSYSSRRRETNNESLLSTYYMLGTVLSTSHIFFPLYKIPMRALLLLLFYIEIRQVRNWGTRRASNLQEALFKPKQPSSRARALIHYTAAFSVCNHTQRSVTCARREKEKKWSRNSGKEMVHFAWDGAHRRLCRTSDTWAGPWRRENRKQVQIKTGHGDQ